MDNKDNKKTNNAEEANMKINQKFDSDTQGETEDSNDQPSETNRVNEKINEEIDSAGKDSDKIPPTYLYNNTPAINISKNKDKDK